MATLSSQDRFAVRNITSFLRLDIKGLTAHTLMTGWLKIPLLRLLPELSTGVTNTSDVVPTQTQPSAQA